MSLELKKLDLHVHTPASHDFDDKTITAEQIIIHAQKMGLDAIAITDHNSVDFIDKARKATSQRGFKIFPGIEISCGGSSHGSIHILALFDPSTTEAKLREVLGKLDIKGKGQSALSSKSPSNVVDIIRGAGGLPVLAHANSKHGALSDIKGTPRTELVQNENLLAVEATSGDFQKEKGKRLTDRLDGKDPVYQRQLAVYKSSDNRSTDDKGHCLASIGSNFTYFRMGELTIESLRQCFEDPDSRIVQDYEIDKLSSKHPRIESLSIIGGFLNGQKFEFSPNMNSIIGGTGTGKSLIVEFLRFVFDRPPQQKDIFSDNKNKLVEQLRINGEIKVLFKDASGEQYELSRKLEKAQDPYSSAVICTNKTTSKEFRGDIDSIFPILIYSQNEILQITRDSQAQLDLLDNFRDFKSHQNKVSDIVQQLGKLDQSLYQAIQESGNLGELLKQQATVAEQVSKLKTSIGASGKKGFSEKYIELSEKKSVIEGKIEEYDALLESVAEVIKDFDEDIPTRPKVPKEILEIIEASISDSYSAVVAALKEQQKAIIKAKHKSQKDLVKWEKLNQYSQVKKKYHKEIKLEKIQEGFEATRQTLMDQKKSLRPKILTAKKASNEYTSLRTKRSGLLAELATAKLSYFSERSDQARLITDKSEKKLKIVVHSGDNNDTYLKLLNKLKVGSHAEKTEIEHIVSLVSPVDLVEIVLDKDIQKLSQVAKLTERKAESIINGLRIANNLLETLSLQHKGYPEDRVEISYQKKDGNYYPLSQLSMGQKADALIMIALGDASMPVVIDQPEDALDIPSIWAGICSKLRMNKHGRQFLFTTHSSSVSVSSDSDQYIVLEADGSKGWLARSGSIEQQKIKDDVVGHLEGGYPSYRLKRKKYGL